MDKKEMTVLEFVEKYQNTTSEKIKNDLLKKIIKRSYCPILEKRTVLQAMLDSSVIQSLNGKYIDLVTSRISYTLSLIILYTTLKLDIDTKTNQAKIHEIYDELVKNNLLEKICSLLGEKEVSELSVVNELLIQNFNNMNNSLYAIIGHFTNNIGQKIGIAMGYALEQLDSFTVDKNSITDVIDIVKAKISK